MTTPNATNDERGRMRAAAELVLMVRRVWSLLWNSSRKWTALTILLSATEILASLATLYLLKQLVESLAGHARSGGPVANVDEQLLLAVLWAGLSTFVYLSARALAGLARETQGLLVSEYIDRQIHRKSLEVDLSFYESPTYFDTLRRARDAGSQRPASITDNLLLLGKNAILLVAILALMATIDWVLVPILIGALAPALVVRMYFAYRLHAWRIERTQMERRASYFDWLMTSQNYAKEVRLYQLGDYLLKHFGGLRRRIRNEQFSISSRRTACDLIVGLIATGATFGALGYLALRSLSGETSIGDLVLFLLVFQRAQASGQELIQLISKVYEDYLYLGLIFRFLNIKQRPVVDDKPTAVPHALRKGIRVENLSFRYPGTENFVLQNINMELCPGKTVALVGANGSGKTSLIKLLCRLYEPTDGRISLEGADIRSYGVDEYRRLFGVVFQDYAHFADSVRENIRLGNIHEPEANFEVLNAGRLSGADTFVRHLNHEYDTKLTRMFDNGVELSLGQWQKIAIARAMYREPEVMILDEPSSALDSKSEYNLFSSLEKHFSDKALLIISHRLSTVRHADYIYVLSYGSICQSGTHEELIARPGQYRDLFGRNDKELSVPV